MSWLHLFHWLSSRIVRRTRRMEPRRTPWRFVVPRLERLENRIAPAFALGAAANYAILYEGGAIGNSGGGLLSISNSFTNTTGTGPGQGGGIGNIGVGGAGFASVTGNAAVNGNIDFSASNTGQFKGISPSGAVNFNVSAVTSALNTMNALNITLGALPGTNVAITGDTTINASDGILSASGPGYTNVRVFNATDFTLKAGQTLTINGDGSGDSVVVNISVPNGTYNGGIVLTGGLTPDNVIFNFVGGSNLTGGPSLGINLGAGQSLEGIFLDPNGRISANPSSIVGHLIGGDSSNMPLNGGSAVTAPFPAVTPTLSTTTTPTTVTLGTSPVTLQDSATLFGGDSPIGTITFTLVGPGGGVVDTETVAVNGNGIYNTPTGFTLPSSGTVAGTYQWDATYSGDSNNNAASDINDPAEQVTVNPASPTLVTTASPNVTLPAGPPGTVTLMDSADLEGGYFPTGNLVFTLTGPGGFTFTTTDTVNGNGPYTASTTLPTTGMVAGTYTWTVRYGGDANNTAANDQGGIAEQTVVSPASPTLTTTPNPSTLTAGVTLKDSAVLAGGYHPTGTITFTLFLNGGTTPVDTETVAVNGNGVYTTSTGFTPSTGTGTYQWDAVYNGDANNNAFSDINDPAEQVPATAPAVTLTTTPIPATVTLGINPVTLTDTASLGAGVNPTGTITFMLVGPGGSVVDTEEVTVNGDGIYSTPTGFTLPTSGPLTGTYQWEALYSGDANNPGISDIGATNEQVTVNAASPGLVSIASPSSVRLGPSSVTVRDEALLAGGYHPTGTITFTLVGPDGSVVGQPVTAAVNGNGLYFSPTLTLPSTGTVTGTYLWHATYNGDANNNTASEASPVTERVIVSAATPTLTTTSSPTTVTLSAATPPVLTDSATLANGFGPTGTITFTLVGPGGATVDRETVAVNGNGTYTTPTGFILPATGVVIGTYQWDATYSGDGNNISVSDNNAANERVTVAAATPTFSTTPNPTTVTLGAATPPILTDSATLSGGFNPTGRIFFVLFKIGSSTPLDIESVTINGNGTYTTPTGFTLPTSGPAAGTYQWDASYSGDFNNFPVVDNNAANEQVTVSQAIPTLITTAVPNTVPSPAPGAILVSDTADLEGGFKLTGTIVFTLTGPGGFKFTQTDTVNGNGPYMASTTLPAAGTFGGTYTWTAQYSGDTNNTKVNDQGGPAEQVTIPPTMVTKASPDITLGTTAPTLSDEAVLSGVDNPTGTIVFTLTGPGGFTFTQTDRVNGNGPYTASTTLPATGIVVGTYTWTAQYSGDANNRPSLDQGGPAEQTVVSPTTPTIVTTASPSTAMLGTTLQDSADLTGFFPTGSITFRLYAPGVDPTVGSAAYTEVVGVNGNGTYHTTVGFASNVTGIWHWVATYNGDSNNSSVSSGALDEPVTIPSQADVSLTKEVNQTVAIIGTPVTYTLIVRNNGPDTATGVVATDVLPAGLVFVSATPSQGSFDPGSGHWTIGTLANGATVTLQITGIVAAIGPITNTASVAALEADPDLANSSSTATIDGMFSSGQISKRMLLSSNDAPLNSATLAAEEALLHALVPIAVNIWDELLSVAQSLLAARNDPGPGNSGVPVFEGNWFGSPLVVYANPFAGQVTAVRMGAFDFLYENNAVNGIRML